MRFARLAALNKKVLLTENQQHNDMKKIVNNLELAT